MYASHGAGSVRHRTIRQQSSVETGSLAPGPRGGSIDRKMQALHFCDHSVMTAAAPLPNASVLVVCLCAQWCGTCRDYRQRFAKVQAQFPALQFLWIDVEDEADLLDPLDVDDFPTLLLAVGDTPHFFGPLAPQADTLARLLRALTENSAAPALADAAVTALVARIRASRST